MTTEPIDYPKRGPFFAHKSLRLMHKAAVPAEIGRDAFALITVVVLTEDAARYRGPVRFYNAQLMETLGFTKWETFAKVRSRAVESGWLNYKGCGKRTAGLYWVTVPEGFDQIDDSPMEEPADSLSPDTGYKRGYNDGYKRGYDEGVMRGINGGTTMELSGGQMGGSTYPIPNPIPNPSPTSGESEKKQRKPKLKKERPVYTKEESVGIYTCSNGETWTLTRQHVAELRAEFPLINIAAEAKDAKGWIEEEPRTRRKTYEGMPRFLSNWMKRADPRKQVPIEPPRKMLTPIPRNV